MSTALAINPPSDIVLGVANAADPQKLRAAAAQLVRAGDGTAVENAGLAGTDTGAQLPASWSVPSNDQPVFDPQANASTPQAVAFPKTATPKRTPDIYTKFEAFLVQTFVESMLPSDAPDVFGSGMAGKIWKSMLAEHLADSIAESTSFGIADRIAKNREKNKAGLPAEAAALRQDGSATDAKTGKAADPRGHLSAPALSPAASVSKRGLG